MEVDKMIDNACEMYELADRVRLALDDDQFRSAIDVALLGGIRVRDAVAVLEQLRRDDEIVALRSPAGGLIYKRPGLRDLPIEDLLEDDEAELEILDALDVRAERTASEVARRAKLPIAAVEPRLDGWVESGNLISVQRGKRRLYRFADAI